MNTMTTSTVAGPVSAGTHTTPGSGTHTNEGTARDARRWMWPAVGAGLLALGAAAGVLIGRHTAVPDVNASAVVMDPATPTQAAQNAQAAQVAAAQNAATAKLGAAPGTAHKPATKPATPAEPRWTQPQPPLATQPARSVAVCATCGTVESVTAQTQKGEGSGVGAVAGGVVGGLLGNQIGKGDGRTAATVLGAIGGGLAGNEIEKRQRASTVYLIKVRMDDGSLRSFTRSESWAAGQRVTVDGSTLRASTASANRGTPSDPILRTSDRS